MSEPERITSADNQVVKRIRGLLKSSKERRRTSEFVLEGANCVNALLDKNQNRIVVESVIASDSITASPGGRKLFEQAGDARRIVLEDKLMERIQDVRTSQGVMAVARIPAPPPLPLAENGHYLLLDRLSDPGNAGTIIRTAVGLGIDGIMLYGDCVDVYNPKCVRATAGMLPFIDIRHVDLTDIDSLLNSGFELTIAERDAGDSIFEIEFNAKCIVAVGNEAHGLSDELESRAAKAVHIPLQPVCESLNAAMAAGMLMLMMRKRA